MPLLPTRRFARLDSARFRKRTLRHALIDVVEVLDRLPEAHGVFVAEGDVVPLARTAQELVDGLCESFRLPPRRVFMRDRPRPHKRKGGRIVYELHGLCTEDGLLEVYARTAAKAKPVALPTLLNTLLHEWVHHWDFETFGTSVHCSGFYHRLNQLYRPAVEQVRAHVADGR